MSKQKAEWGLECGAELEGDSTKVYLAEATPTPQTMSMQVDTTAEGGPKETHVTPVAATTCHVDELGASLLWVLLRNAGYTVW